MPVATRIRPEMNLKLEVAKNLGELVMMAMAAILPMGHRFT